MLTIEDNRNCPWTTNHNRFRGEAEEKLRFRIGVQVLRRRQSNDVQEV